MWDKLAQDVAASGKHKKEKNWYDDAMFIFVQNVFIEKRFEYICLVVNLDLE